jgi:ribosomal protein S18 acetylase RimI-like enzyme
MTLADCGRVVDVHLAAFQGFFLTLLGPRFLRLLYSEAVLMDEIALVAEDRGELIGFVMGSTDPRVFFKNLLRRRSVGFASAAVPAVLRRPTIAVRVARAIRKPKIAARPVGTATLMSLGVDPGIQGSGAGKLLVLAFIEEARRRGATHVDLTTDKIDNERANAFYRRIGFTVAREIVTPEQRVLNEYEMEVSGR